MESDAESPMPKVVVSSNQPIQLRWARKTLDGGHIEMELQGCYEWWGEHARGLEWRAIEIVDV
jgi:hypothetical protein